MMNLRLLLAAWLVIALATSSLFGCALFSSKPDTPIADSADSAEEPPPEAAPETVVEPETTEQPVTVVKEDPAPEEAVEATEEAEEEVAAEEESTSELSKNGSARQDFEDAVVVAAAEPNRAMSLFERAAQADPTFVIAWHNAGVVAEQQGKMTAAVGYYKKALEQQPDYQPSLFNLVQMYRRLGRPQDGLNLTQRVLAKKSSASALAAAGAAALAANKIRDGAAYAKKALKEDEKNVAAMIVLASSYHAQQKFELAKFVLNNAQAIEPENALVYEGLGRAYLGLKNKKAALKNFETAVGLRQDLPESYNNLAALYYEIGDYIGAGTASKQAVALAPKMGMAWLNHGNSLRADKRYKEAIEAYNKAAGYKESQVNALFNLGLVYLDNEIEGLDLVEKMNTAVKYLSDYRGRARLSVEEAEKLEKYITAAERLRDREIKNRERSAKRKAKQEAKRKAEEEAKIKAEEEAKRQAAEAEAKRKAEEEAKIKAEQEAKRKAEEEARIKAEQEAKRKAEEAAKAKAEEEARTRKIGGGEK